MAATRNDETSNLPMAEIDDLMLHLFRLIADGLATATRAFLAGDVQGARRVIAADTEFDTLQEEIEQLVEARLVGGDIAELPLLLAVVRIVPELERSGDLVEHIALRTSNGLVSQLTETVAALVAGMAEIGVELWRSASGAYAQRDRFAADRLRLRDDELDDLHVRLTAELGAGSLAPALAIEMGLLARFYERLGDHAVNVVKRLPRTPVEALAS